jgi:hypothetical protein
MARVPACGFSPLRRESVGRGVIDKIGVCPSVRVRESLGIFFDYVNRFEGVRHDYKIGCHRIPFEGPLDFHDLGPVGEKLAVGGKALPIRLRALTKVSYDNVWSNDGVAHPKYVCGYQLGLFIELNVRTGQIIVEEFERGNIVNRQEFQLGERVPARPS